MPQLPGRLSNEQISQYKQEAFDRETDLRPLRATKNAYEWNSTSGKQPATLLPLSGHSNQCVLLPKESGYLPVSLGVRLSRR